MTNKYTLSYIQGKINNGHSLIYMENNAIPNDIISDIYGLNDIISFSPAESRYFAQIFDVIREDYNDRNLDNYVFAIINNNILLDLKIEGNKDKLENISNNLLNKFSTIFEKEFYNYSYGNGPNFRYNGTNDEIYGQIENIISNLKEDLNLNIGNIIDLEYYLDEYDKNNNGIVKLKMDKSIKRTGIDLLYSILTESIGMNTDNKYNLFIILSIITLLDYNYFAYSFNRELGQNVSDFTLFLFTKSLRYISEIYLNELGLYDININISEKLNELVSNNYFIIEYNNLYSYNNELEVNLGLLQDIYFNYNKYLNIIDLETKLLKQFV